MLLHRGKQEERQRDALIRAAIKRSGKEPLLNRDNQEKRQRNALKCAAIKRSGNEPLLKARQSRGAATSLSPFPQHQSTPKRPKFAQGAE